MTNIVETPYFRNVGNSVTTVWPFTFQLVPDSTMLLYLVDNTTLVWTPVASNLFSVTLNPDLTGTVTYPLSGSPLTSSTSIVGMRDTDRTQTVSFANQTRYFADIIELLTDKIVAGLQDVGWKADRSPLSTVAQQPLSTPLVESVITMDATGKFKVALPFADVSSATAAAVAAANSAIAAANSAVAAAAVVATSLLKANNLSDLTNVGTARTNLGVAIGSNVQAFSAELATLAALSSTGFLARTGAATYVQRNIVAGTGITVTFGNGASGNPTIAINSAASITGSANYPTDAAVKTYVDGLTSTSAILTATAALTAGGVGTYGFFDTVLAATTYALGGTVAGSSLIWASVGPGGEDISGNPSGTWRALSVKSSAAARAGLFVRTV